MTGLMSEVMVAVEWSFKILQNYMTPKGHFD